MHKDLTTYSTWRAFGILLRRFTEAGVVLFLFIPGIRVVQYGVERENECFVEKFSRAAGEAMSTLGISLKYVIF